MKGTKKGHMLKLHSYYESYVYENIWLPTLNLSFTFPPTQQHFFFFISQILQSTQAFPLSFSLLYALDALLSFGTALSLIVPLVLLVETASERGQIYSVSHIQKVSVHGRWQKRQRSSVCGGRSMQQRLFTWWWTRKLTVRLKTGAKLELSQVHSLWPTPTSQVLRPKSSKASQNVTVTAH